MRATISVLTQPSMLTSATAVEPTAFTAYNAATTYGLGDLISVAADFANYESLAAANTGNTPLSSPLWWRKIGPTETAYNAGTTYGLGDTVHSAATHHCYESLAAGNIGNPLPVLPETETTKWIDLGMTNKFAAFDLDRNTQTVYTSPMSFVITPAQRVNTIGVTGMDATELLIKVTSVAQGGTIYPLAYSATKTYAKNECMTVGLTTCYKCLLDGTVGIAAPNATYWTAVNGAIFSLYSRQVFNATDYYFLPFDTYPSKIVFDIPLVSDPVITITLTHASGNVKCGSIVAGMYVYLGQLLKPARNDGRGFSTVTRDDYGNATLVKRRMLPVMKGNSLLPAERINSAIAARSTLDAQPVLYTGVDEDGDWTDMFIVLGVYQQFDIESTEGPDAMIIFEAEEI